MIDSGFQETIEIVATGASGRTTFVEIYRAREVILKINPAAVSRQAFYEILGCCVTRAGTWE